MQDIKAPEGFVALRKALGIRTQAKMAELLGFSPRTVYMLESDPDGIQSYHIKAAEMLALEMAVERGDRSLAPKHIADLADRFAALGMRQKA